jgi:hypothetical protein
VGPDGGQALGDAELPNCGDQQINEQGRNGAGSSTRGWPGRC